MEIKNCMTCKFAKKHKYNEPCRTCCDIAVHEGKHHTKWEPKEPERIEIKLEKRPEMLPLPLPIYEHTDSEIPEKIRISFTNGTSAVYELRVDQPAPQIVESIKIIRRMRQGYVNQPMRRRRNRR